MFEAEGAEIRSTVLEANSCIDLFFVRGLTFLLSVSKPLDLMMVTYLPDGKKMEGIWKSLVSHISTYRSRMFEITAVRSDREGAVLGLEDKIKAMHMILELASKAEHVGPIERKVGLTEEVVGGILHVLPFKLTKMMLIWLMYFSVHSLNQRVNDLTPGAVCPFSNFVLRKESLIRKLTTVLDMGSMFKCTKTMDWPRIV